MIALPWEYGDERLDPPAEAPAEAPDELTATLPDTMARLPGALADVVPRPPVARLSPLCAIPRRSSPATKRRPPGSPARSWAGRSQVPMGRPRQGTVELGGEVRPVLAVASGPANTDAGNGAVPAILGQGEEFGRRHPAPA
jgi:hypothetical protein